MKKIIVIAVAAPLLAVAAEEPDSRGRAIVAPERIVASSDGVGGAEFLCSPRFGQVAEGPFLNGGGPVLAKGGWIILDFGRELHGSVQIGSRSGRAHV